VNARATVVVALALLASCVSAPERRAVAEEYYNLGNSYLAAGKVEHALSLFEIAIQTDASLLQAHYNLTLALLRLGRGEEAMKMLNALLARDPDNLTVMSLLGYALYTLGRYPEALDRYDLILASSPGDRDALYNRGLVLWKLERYDEAAKAFETVADRTPADDLALRTMLQLAALHRERKEWDAAAQSLERYLEWKPESADVLLDLAAVYREQKRYLPAIEAYRRAAKLDPEKVEAWFGQAELLLTVIDDPDGGLLALERALQGGFQDKARLAALLADERLADRDRVRALVARWGLREERGKSSAGTAPAPPPAQSPATTEGAPQDQAQSTPARP
jgi:tetratricopeptide (TPR) repeat protein